MEDKKVERQIVCPYRVEAMISNMDMLLKTLSRLMTKGGTYKPSDDETQEVIDNLMLCDKNCAAWETTVKVTTTDGRTIEHGHCIRVKNGGRK